METLRELRRQVVALGLSWAADWDRERLQDALLRVETLKRIRAEELKRLAQEIGAQAGDHPRKQDWLVAVLKAEFPPLSPKQNSGKSARRLGVGERLLQLSGALGLVVIGVAMVIAPLVAWRLNQVGQTGLHVGETWAEQTADTLRKSSESLKSASAALESSNRALRSIGTSLDGAQPLLTSIGDVLGSQAPDAVSTARESLVNAQSGAQSIDRVLSSLSFLGIGYNPDKPLAQGLAETAESLAPLPGALSEASDHLAMTQKDLLQVSQNVVQVSDDVANMATQISPVAEDLGQEADQLDGLSGSIGMFAERLPIWIWGGAALVELVLVNAAITQYAVWVVGRRERPVAG